MNSESNVATLFLRKMIVVFLVIVLVLYTSFTVLFVLFNIEPFKYLMYMYIFQHVMWLFGLVYFKKLSFEPLITMYLSYILVAQYPIACIYWNSGNPIVFSWYLLVILGAIVFDRRNIGLWIPWISTMVISIFFCSPLFPKENFSALFTNLTNILTVIATIVLASFFAIVYVKKTNIDESIQAETLKTTAENAENLERDRALYNEIINYLEKNKPFKNPNFNAQALAMALNSNVNYISKAISVGGSGDFHTLLNSFRINYAKSMLDSGAMKKYTIDYIYTEAGYKYRSTFNSAFKDIMGMTPSDYVSQQNTFT